MSEHSLEMSLSTPSTACVAQQHGSALPECWIRLFEELLPANNAEEQSRFSEAELSECTAACEESLREQGPLTLRVGRLEDVFIMRQEIASYGGGSFRVMEGVDRTTQHNFSLKLVSTSPWSSRRIRERARHEPIDMQAYYSIGSFIEEVFCQPGRCCLCFKWGLHEMDSTHQLSCLVVDALMLLIELMPSHVRKHAKYLRVGKDQLQRVLLRSMALDAFLQRNLFLQL